MSVIIHGSNPAETGSGTVPETVLERFLLSAVLILCPRGPWVPQGGHQAVRTRKQGLEPHRNPHPAFSSVFCPLSSPWVC